MPKIKYPTGTKPKFSTYKIPNANRGMAFEDSLNETNSFYKEMKRALIYKRPTPINVVKTDSHQPGLITKAYFESKSTTDYNGVYKGRYIDFEAKSCRSKTSFPLSNIQPQQLEHLKSVLFHEGIAFFLIRFDLLDECYLLSAKYVISFIKNSGRNSIPLKDIRKNGYYIKQGYIPRYDYLKFLDEFFL